EALRPAAMLDVGRAVAARRAEESHVLLGDEFREVRADRVGKAFGDPALVVRGRTALGLRLLRGRCEHDRRIVHGAVVRRKGSANIGPRAKAAKARSSACDGLIDQRSCHFGSRFSMNAQMPSSASRAIMFSVITSEA